MKYSTRDLPSTVDVDFQRPTPAPRPTFGRVICGLCALVGCFSWPALILSLEVVTK